MNRTGVRGLVLILALAAAQPIFADVVTDWNSTALDAIRSHGTPPPAAARNLSILHVAVYDAVNSLLGTHEPYLVPPAGAPADASIVAAASSAARDVLASLYPAHSDAFDEINDMLLASVMDGPHKAAGAEWGCGRRRADPGGQSGGRLGRGFLRVARIGRPGRVAAA